MCIFFTLIPWKHEHEHIYAHTRLETVSVLLVWVPSSVPVCLLGFGLSSVKQPSVAVCCVSSGYVSGLGACEWLFCCGCFCFCVFFLSWSLYLCCFLRVGGRGWLARALGSLLLACYQKKKEKVCGFWLPVSAGLQVGWRSLHVCSPSGVLLKGIHQVFFLGGGGGWDEMFLCQRMRALSRHQIHPRDLGGP